MSDFVLALMRMNNRELLEFFVGEVEARAIAIYNTKAIDDEEWKIINQRTDKIEVMKAEITRRMG